MTPQNAQEGTSEPRGRETGPELHPWDSGAAEGRFWTTPDGRPGCPDCDWIAPPSFAGDDEPQTTVGLHRLAAHLLNDLTIGAQT